MTEIIIIILAGLLAAPSIFSGKSKTADEFIKKNVAPWQGYIGVLLVIWGVWNVIDLVTHMSILKEFPIFWITLLAISLLELCLGILLGYNLAVGRMKGNPQAALKAEAVYKKLVPWQTTLGMIAVGLGVWGLVYYYVWY